MLALMCLAGQTMASSLQATGNGNSLTISGTWDTLLIFHRDVPSLSEALRAATPNSTMGDLQSVGTAMKIGIKDVQSLSLPEAGPYWLFGKVPQDSAWQAARYESVPPTGRLVTWFDAIHKLQIVRVAIPDDMPADSLIVLQLGSASVSGKNGAFASVPPPSGGAFLQSSVSGHQVIWMAFAASASDSAKAILSLVGAPSTLVAYRAPRDAQLEAATHLLCRMTKEAGNPLLSASSSGASATAAASTQVLFYWQQLVDAVPTWGGHVELLEGLLNLKKGGAGNAWSSTAAALGEGDVRDSLGGSSKRPLYARQSQPNLTGPVYYGAYTRATLDDNVHFPLREGELLQIQWQGSADLYYYEPAAGGSGDSILTRLQLPDTTGFYDKSKQLLLGQGDPLYDKIRQSGLWVKGIERSTDDEPTFFVSVDREIRGDVSDVSGQISSIENSNADNFLRASIQDLPIQWMVVGRDSGYSSLMDTMAITESDSQTLKFKVPEGMQIRKSEKIESIDDGDSESDDEITNPVFLLCGHAA